jgi:hypothetical protein
MSQLTIRGTVHDLLPPTSQEYQGRNYATQVLVIDISTTNPHLVAFEFDPDKDTLAASAHRGEEVNITFYPISREGKNANAGKFFTTLKIKRIEIAGRGAQAPAYNPPPQQTNPAPQANTPEPSPIAAAAEEAANDDLPF